MVGDVAKNVGDKLAIQVNDANDDCALPIAASRSARQPESISILTIEDGIFEMKAITGDTHLSCEDFDDSVVNFCMQGFTLKKRAKDLAGKHRVIL